MIQQSWKTTIEPHLMTFELNELGEEFTKDLNRRGRFTIFAFSGKEESILDLVLSFEINDKLKSIANFLILKSQTVNAIRATEAIEEIVSQYKIPESTTRRAFQELVKEGILFKPEVLLNGNPCDKAYCYQFYGKKEILNSLSRNKIAKSNNHNRNTIEDQESIKSSIESMGLTLADIDAKKHLKDGLLFYPSLIPLQYLSLAPEKRNGKNYVKEEFSHVVGNETTGRYAIEAAAHDQVVTTPAILTLMALINLSIAYNAKMLQSGRYQEPFENKEVPIHLLDIIYVRGIKDSGQARIRIRNHIQELRETIYNWIDLTGIKDENMKDIFGSKDFQYIVGLKTNAEISPVKLRNGRIRTNPMLFFIKFNDILIDKLKSKRLLFTLPYKIVMDDPLIFTFYLVLRQMNRSRESILLRDIAEKMYYMNSTNKLYSLLKDRLEENYKAESNLFEDNDFVFDYNLCGYYLSFNKNPDGDRTVHLYCDHEEMIKHSGAEYNPKLKDYNAPTLPNPVYASAETVEEIQTREKAQNIASTLLQMYLDESTRRALQYRRLLIGNKSLDVSAYTTNEELSVYSIIISQQFDIEEDVVDIALNFIKEIVKPLGYSEFTISMSKFHKLKAHLVDVHNLELDTIELINLTKHFRLKNMQLWYNEDYESVAKEVLSRITIMQYV
ncbi:TPA: DUF3346 domain-containing protein [Vibrio vulnificus]|uniref:replication initiator protein RctB domain-containing protein n=3 Tax=Vibrionaceae TaxID=641 RepID=UPI001A35221A|nr:DUF3346 domain-containing protein [Vibrio vulnificus]